MGMDRIYIHAVRCRAFLATTLQHHRCIKCQPNVLIIVRVKYSISLQARVGELDYVCSAVLIGSGNCYTEMAYSQFSGNPDMKGSFSDSNTISNRHSYFHETIILSAKFYFASQASESGRRCWNNQGVIRRPISGNDKSVPVQETSLYYKCCWKRHVVSSDLQTVL